MPKDDFEEKFKREYDLVPRPVVESRTDKKPAQFTPEVMFNGANWIVGLPEATHDAAMQAAESRCDAVRAAMVAGGMAQLAGCKKARA